jgi:hypothetical protein
VYHRACHASAVSTATHFQHPASMLDSYRWMVFDDGGDSCTIQHMAKVNLEVRRLIQSRKAELRRGENSSPLKAMRPWETCRYVIVS